MRWRRGRRGEKRKERKERGEEGEEEGEGGGVVILKNKKFIFFVISPRIRVKIYGELQKKITNTTPVKNKTHPTPW